MDMIWSCTGARDFAITCRRFWQQSDLTEMYPRRHNFLMAETPIIVGLLELLMHNEYIYDKLWVKHEKSFGLHWALTFM